MAPPFRVGDSRGRELLDVLVLRVAARAVDEVGAACGRAPGATALAPTSGSRADGRRPGRSRGARRATATPTSARAEGRRAGRASRTAGACRRERPPVRSPTAADSIRRCRRRDRARPGRTPRAASRPGAPCSGRPERGLVGGAGPRSHSASGESGSSGTMELEALLERGERVVGRQAVEPLELGALPALDPRHLGVGRRGRDHGHAVDEVGAPCGQRQRHPSTGRPAGDADRPDAHAVEHGGELVGGCRHRRPVPGGDGDEPPYPGRSIESRRTFRARVTAGLGSKQPAPGALWQRTTAGSRTPASALRKGTRRRSSSCGGRRPCDPTRARNARSRP